STRSVRLTIPIGRPLSSTTGAPAMRCSANRRATAASDVSRATAMTSRTMTFSTTLMAHPPWSNRPRERAPARVAGVAVGVEFHRDVAHEPPPQRGKIDAAAVHGAQAVSRMGADAVELGGERALVVGVERDAEVAHQRADDRPPAVVVRAAAEPAVHGELA